MKEVNFEKVLFYDVFNKREYRPTVNCLIKCQNKILVALRPGDELYYPIQGGVKINENLKDACHREIREELGIDDSNTTFHFERLIGTQNREYPNVDRSTNDGFSKGKMYLGCLLTVAEELEFNHCRSW
jgi:8-oxo-dGTP pyrophosphatase MutT (NUDIX family)